MSSIENIKEAVYQGSESKIIQYINEALENGISPIKILDDGILEAVKFLLDEYINGEIYIPEVLIIDKAVKAGLRLLSQYYKPVGNVVVCSVQYDLTEYYKGKGILPLILRAERFNIINGGEGVTESSIDYILLKGLPDIFIIITGGWMYRCQVKEIIQRLREICGDNICIILYREKSLIEDIEVEGADLCINNPQFAFEVFKKIIDGKQSANSIVKDNDILQKNKQFIKNTENLAKETQLESNKQNPNAADYLVHYEEKPNFILDYPLLVIFSPQWNLPGANPDQICVEQFKNKSEAIERFIEIFHYNMEVDLLENYHKRKLRNHINKLEKVIKDINEKGTDESISLKEAEIEIDSFEMKIICAGYWPEISKDILEFAINKLEDSECSIEYGEDIDFEELGSYEKVFLMAKKLIECHDTDSSKYLMDFGKFYDELKGQFRSEVF